MRNWLLTVASIIIAALAIFCLTWGFEYSVPDLVLTSHGIPLRWGVRTLITIAGPVDKWSVDLNALVIDLVLWFSIVIVIQLLNSSRH